MIIHKLVFIVARRAEAGVGFLVMGQLTMGWVDPLVGFGWVETFFSFSGLGRVAGSNPG